ncbi:MAG TPA: cytochrome c [Bryobacteraceae bacterium]|nr:cytochrome c [Bryobacteraceae bacterium]
MRNSISLMIAGVVLLAGSSLYGQGKKGGAAGDAGKGKGVFDQNCAVCHNADSADVKMGPGLKGLFKPGYKLKSGGAANDASVRAKIDAGGNGMPSYKDILSDAEKNDVLAYLKTL